MNPTTHPIAYDVVDHRLNWARVQNMYVRKNAMYLDVQGDSAWPSIVSEATDPTHPNADITARVVVYKAMGDLLSGANGWHSRSSGRGAHWFHEDNAIADDWRDNCNLRIEGRDWDEAAILVAVAKCAAACQRDGRVFDPQYDTTGKLVRVEVW